MPQQTEVTPSATALNSQITDSIAQADTEVVGLAPASASGSNYQSNAQALALAAFNATNAQQQNTINLNASTPVAINTLYAIDTGDDGTGVPDIFDELRKVHTKKGARIKIRRK